MAFHHKYKDLKSLQRVPELQIISEKALLSACPAFLFFHRHLLWRTDRRYKVGWAIGLTDLVLFL